MLIGVVLLICNIWFVGDDVRSFIRGPPGPPGPPGPREDGSFRAENYRSSVNSEGTYSRSASSGLSYDASLATGESSSNLFRSNGGLRADESYAGTFGREGSQMSLIGAKGSSYMRSYDGSLDYNELAYRVSENIQSKYTVYSYFICANLGEIDVVLNIININN